MKVIPLHNNEKKLIQKAKKQDRKAQKLLYDTYAPKMLSICRMYIKDLHYAEDVMLKAFYKVFAHLKSYRGEGSFEGWIRKITVREAIDFLRVKKQVSFTEEIGKTPTGSAENVTIIDDAEYLQQLIDTLPEGYKIVFVMYAVEGYKHREIAKVLDISEGTSKSQLAKARKFLQEKLKPYENTDKADTQ